MSKINISAIVNTRNESRNIADCLKALAFADEIIVVDMESSDATKEIAKRFTDKVFDHKMIGYVEPARNFAISKAVGKWVLIVDADERVPRSLAAKLIEIAQKEAVDFVRIPRKNLIFGQWIQHSRWWPDYNIRFFKKDSVEWQNEIHSIPITTGTGINLDPEEEYALEHHHYNSIDEYFERALRYSTQQAKELVDSGYKFDAKDIIGKPISEFISRFFAGEGYKDGLHGLVLAFLQMFSVMLIYLKVWQAEGHEPKKASVFTPIWQKLFMEKYRELRYWFMTVLIQSESKKTKRFLLKIKRKLSS
ncbi:MAG TPA: glycosyltransferase family 2 protein [Candidatus Woesebacteria bacterium]|nr:glycosyltransferase family 2 protein [Candidatus Woesebacteria bacterium]